MNRRQWQKRQISQGKAASAAAVLMS